MKIKKDKIQKLAKYLTKEEMISLKEALGSMPHLYLEEFKTCLSFLKQTKPFAGADIDPKCLSILMVTFLYGIVHKKRDSHLKNEIRPLLIGGLNQLLEALELYRKHPYNIEEIIIVGKGHKPIGKENSNLPMTEIRKKQDSKPIKYSISGIELIMKIFSYIDSTEESFLEMAKREKISENQTNSESAKKKIEPVFLKKYSTILYNYFRDHLPENHTDRKIYIMGSILAEMLGIMPKPTKLLNSDKKLNAFRVSNFKKALIVQL